jgi:hypothetical protein
MWIHFAESVGSAMAIFVGPLLLLVAMVGAEVLLDRTLRLFSDRAVKSKRQARA